MAMRELARFCSEYLRGHPDLRAKLDRIPADDAFARAMVSAGSDAGYGFTIREVMIIMDRPEPPPAPVITPDELSDDQLDAVAGGDAKDPPKKDQKVDYLIIRLHDILISG